MRALSLIALVFLMAGCASGSSPFAHQEAASQPMVLDQITGSRVERNVVVVGNEAHGIAPVHIITKDDLRKSGKTNVADALDEYPYFH